MNKKNIFTIGDRTTLGIITCFRLLDNEIMVDFDNRNSILLKSTQLQHIKQPLFTTEDGVDIKEGDKYFSICKKYWRILETESAVEINYKTYHKNNYNFSSYEKAEEYILLNKPCLSINDINTYCNLSLFTLKELVKSKL